MRAVADGGEASRGGRWTLLVGLFALAAVAVRAWAATTVPTPWIFIDELLHAELAESVAAGDGFRVRGEPITVSFVYPLLIAPAWLADSVMSSYAVAKIVNAIVMTSAAIPVFLLARRVVTARYAALAAVLTLLLPWYALTATLSTENAAFPAFALAFLAIACALERPSVARQLLAVAAIGLAVASRVQGLVLLAVFATAIVVEALLREARAREAIVRFWPAALAVVALGAALAGVEVADEGPFTLGVYTESTDAEYSLAVFKWLAYSAGGLGLSVGLLPLAALAVVVSVARGRGASERAFAAVAASATFWLVVLAGIAGQWRPEGLKERYAIYAAPLLFIAFALWLERGLPRPRLAAAVGALVPAALILLLPLEELFENAAFQSNAFALFPFYRASTAIGSVGPVEFALGLSSLLLALAFVRLPVRARAMLPAAVAAYLLISAAAVHAHVRNVSREVRAGAAAGEHPDWIDRRAGSRARVTFLNTTAFHAETLNGQSFRTWNSFWTTQFWNRSVRGTLDLGFAEPAPLRQDRGTLDWATGEITGVEDADYVLTDRRFPIRAQAEGVRGPFSLFRHSPPLRLASATEGVFFDGSMFGRAAYDRWSPEGEPGGKAVIFYSRRGLADPAVVHVEVGTFKGGGAAQFDVITERRNARVRGGGRATFRIPAPPPPFRVELVVEGAAGGRVSFHYQPRGRPRR